MWLVAPTLNSEALRGSHLKWVTVPSQSGSRSFLLLPFFQLLGPISGSDFSDDIGYFQPGRAVPLSQAWPSSSVLHFSFSIWKDQVDRLRARKLEASLNIPSFSHIFQGNFHHPVVDRVTLYTNSALFSIWLFFFWVSSLSEREERMNGRNQTPQIPCARPNRFLTQNTT